MEIIIPATHEQWLAERAKGIGSSEVATVLGVNPFDTPYRLWRRKRGMDAPQEENEAMRAGHILESAVATYFEQESHRRVIRRSAGDWIAYDEKRPYLRVSPDRTYWTGSKRSGRSKGVLECKTTQMDVDADDLPKHWFCQLQYQLGVMGLTQGSLAWLTRGRRFGFRDIRFDPDFYDYLVFRLEKFWNENVMGGKEPPVLAVEDVMAKWTKSADRAVEATDEIAADVTALNAIKPQIEELNRQKKELEDRIKLYMEDADTLCLQGTKETAPTVIATWRTAKDSVRFDEKAFALEHQQLHDAYMRSVAGSRRFITK